MTDSTLNNYISRGTNAERLAFTPSPPTPGSGNHPSYVFYETDTTNTYMWDGSAWQQVNNSSGSVTKTGSPASGNLTKFSGASTITNGDLSGDVTTSGTLATTIANNAVTTAKINNSAVTLAKIANAAASSKLVGSGASGSGSAYAELSLGTGLSMSGTTLNVANTVTLISEQTPTTTTVTFSSIPSGYRSLRLVWTGRTDLSATADTLNIQFNGDSSAIYDRQLLSGSNTTVTASAAVAQTSASVANCSAASAPSGTAGSGEVIFPYYADTTFHKNAVSRYTYKTGTTASDIPVREIAVSYRSTSAISSIAITAGGNFISGSKFALYGLT